MYPQRYVACLGGRNLVNVHYSEFYLKLESMLIMTAEPYIIMNSCAHYNIITVFHF